MVDRLEGANRGQYLLPVEVVYPGDDDLARTAISGAEFTMALNAIKAKRLTVVLDCCHAGGIGEPRDLVPSAPVAAGLSESYLNYLKSNFTDLEGILAQHIGLEQSQLRFIGVMREDCKPRLGIRARYYLDMTDEDEFETAVARLVAQLRQSPDIESIEG